MKGLATSNTNDGLTASTPSDRAAEFRAVQGGSETRSGTVLLVEAYAAVWIILFAFVWQSFRKQRRLETRLSDLEAELRRRHGIS